MKKSKERGNIIGKKINKLTVKSLAYIDEKNVAFYNCECDCGTNRVVKIYHLFDNHVKSCGCHKRSSQIGDRIGKLTVISRDSKGWLCNCECGNDIIIKDHIKKRKSCGCANKIDLKGQRFGKLVAIKRRKNSSGIAGHHAEWLCKCDCGKKKWILISNLNRGFTKSCGKCK